MLDIALGKRTRLRNDYPYSPAQRDALMFEKLQNDIGARQKQLQEALKEIKKKK